MTRLALARQVVPPLWRAGTWRLVPACAAGVVAVSAVLRLAGFDVAPVAPLVGGGLLLALTAGFALDDDAAAVLAASPTPPAFRYGLRVAGAYATVAASWAVLLAYAASFAPGPVPVGWPTVLVAVLVTNGLLVASLWGGFAAAPALPAFVATAARLPDRWTLLEDSPGATGRLALVLAVAAVALAVRCGRDRAGY